MIQNLKHAGTYYVQVSNKSEVPFQLVSREQPKGLEYPGEMILYPERTVIMELKASIQAIK